MKWTTVMGTLLVVGLCGCEQSGASKSNDDEAKPEKTKKKDAKQAKAGASSKASAATAASGTPPGGTEPAKANDGPGDAIGAIKIPVFTPPPLPAGRTKPPTLEEWDKHTKEVTVKGSSALNCETKVVREWFRASCRGKNDSGGTPTGVKVLKGGREAFTYAGGGIASLVVPFVSGSHVEAVFSWSDKSHKLVMDWPRGAPQPQVLGVYEGAKSPLDASAMGASGLADKLCECHKKVTGQATCEQIIGGPDPDCARTYSDCGKLLACSRGEPGVWPSCNSGFRNAGVIGRCLKVCSDGSCPSGSSCSKEWGDPPICWAD
jgi:hypothetical protein